MHILIVAPSLDTAANVSGVSAVTNFIISQNGECKYEHFLQGRSDGESGVVTRVMRIWRNYRRWVRVVDGNVNGNGNVNVNDNVNNGDFIIHYNYPLDAFSIVRDFFFLKAAHKRGFRMVVHIHGGLYLFKERKPFIIKSILREVFSWDIPFIVLSNKEREQIQRLYGTKNVSVLPNCVDLTEAGLLNDNVDDNDNAINILYLGRIEPNKGMDYLLEAMRVLKGEGARFCLHFAGIEQGNNRYIERFAELLDDRFVYEGVVSGEKKTELLKKCQVFVMPSFYEGLPMSLLETMSFGMVPVVTDVGSIGEYVKNGENGLMTEVKDTASIVAAIDKLLHDRDLLHRMSVAARETIFSRLQPKKYVEQLNEIYKHV